MRTHKDIDWGVPSRGGSLWGTLADPRLLDKKYCSVAYLAYAYEFCNDYEFEHLIPLHWDMVQSNLDNLVTSSELEEARRRVANVRQEVARVKRCLRL